LDAISSGMFSPDDPARHLPIVSSLLERDEFMLLADFAAYRDCHARAETMFQDESAWTQKAILNVARMGRFSSDATISDYARDIWNVTGQFARK